MHTITRLIFAVGLALAPVLPAATAQATDLKHTWVASAAAGGNNSNSCDITAPCATFTGAYNNTAAGGEITCLDSGDYGGARHQPLAHDHMRVQHRQRRHIGGGKYT
jgi:hypothetical protein